VAIFTVVHAASNTPPEVTGFDHTAVFHAQHAAIVGFVFEAWLTEPHIQKTGAGQLAQRACEVVPGVAAQAQITLLGEAPQAGEQEQGVSEQQAAQGELLEARGGQGHGRG
jgi:hypothetical protein